MNPISPSSFIGLPPEGLRINLKYKVPSLNRLLAMNHWQRHREKKVARSAFELWLRACAADYSTKTISAPSTSSISFDMAEYCATILLTLSKSKSDKRRSKQKTKKKQ